MAPRPDLVLIRIRRADKESVSIPKPELPISLVPSGNALALGAK